MTSSSPRIQSRHQAFTLIELLMVIMIISILAALTLGAFRFANVKAGRDKTKAIIKAIELGLDKYELEYGSYPSGDINAYTKINPATSAIGASAESASILYQVLTGDANSDGEIVSPEEPIIDIGAGIDDKLQMFEGDATSGYYFADPFGNPIQYSVLIDISAPTAPPDIVPTNPHDAAPLSSSGTNNNATYDLWSYGEADAPNHSDPNDDEALWIKNW